MKKITIITTMASLLFLSACSSDGTDSSSNTASASYTSKPTVLTGDAQADKNINAITNDYKNVVVAFIYAKSYSLLSVGKNEEANAAKADADALKNNKDASISDISAAMSKNGISDNELDNSKELSAEAREAFGKSVGYLSFAVAQEALLVKTATDMAKQAQDMISSAPIMKKSGLVSAFKPIIDLAGRLPKDLQITSATLADYVDYAMKNGFSKEDIAKMNEKAQASIL